MLSEREKVEVFPKLNSLIQQLLIKWLLCTGTVLVAEDSATKTLAHISASKEEA